MSVLAVDIDLVFMHKQAENQILNIIGHQISNIVLLNANIIVYVMASQL